MIQRIQVLIDVSLYLRYFVKHAYKICICLLIVNKLIIRPNSNSSHYKVKNYFQFMFFSKNSSYLFLVQKRNQKQ